MKTRRQRAAAVKMVYDDCGSKQCLMVAMDNGKVVGGDR
jgi:hypothetical protein